MSEHNDWVASAVLAVEDVFPSLSGLDVRRLVEVAVTAYEEAKEST